LGLGAIGREERGTIDGAAVATVRLAWHGLSMLSLDTASVFFLASVLLALAPGPDNVFVLTNASVFGRKAGLLVTLGLCSGLLVHTGVVVVGLAAVLEASPTAFLVLKFVGAAYLLHLAWLAVRAPALALPEGASSRSGGRWYFRGIVLNVTNPKVAMFFLAFLPQFVEAQDDAWWQTVQLGALFVVATVLVFGTIAILAGAIGDRLRRSPRAQLVLNRSAAMVFVVLAFRLLLAH
jgi:threonine/homoserine/homoserine lactone efflux protein